MKYRDIVLAVGLTAFIFSVSGCVVRTYSVKKDRVDQELSGNSGYLQGSKPAGQEKERSSQRKVYVAEVEIGSSAKVAKKDPAPQASDTQVSGNRGYIEEAAPEQAVMDIQEEAAVKTEKYTVQKNDTLQKISQKLYGTTRNWYKIYQANKDALKGPDKIYPGQVINVPVLEKEPLKEPKENLK
ncbi:MAG: LysM peptidoglycan-binding domain-containing protein [Candidatus Omnitrophota bacterium]|jgi:nucleoid-associated protein YgaU